MQDLTCLRLPRRQEKETGQNQRAGEHQYLRGREERGWTIGGVRTTKRLVDVREERI